MLTTEQLQWLGLTASHRAFALEERCAALEGERKRLAEVNEQMAKALHEAKALIERVKKGPPADETSDAAPLPPIVPPPPAEASPDEDDGVAEVLDIMAHAIVAEPA